MKTINKVLIFLVVALLLVALALWLSKPEKAFKKVALQHNNAVSNYTAMPFLDTVALVGLDSLGLCDIKLYIKPLSNTAKENFDSGIELKALVFGHGDEYMIWIDNMGRQESITVIAHELIHLVQYKSRQLIYGGFYVDWNGAQYDIKEIPYENRPWEIDAFEKQVPLQRKIKATLY